jgi:tRNA G18 (ribose-2'-O)-methylase SpoU
MVILGHSTALIASSYHHYASRVIASRRRHIWTTPSPKQMMSAVRCPHQHRSRLFSFTSDRYEEQERIIALHAELQKLNIDAAALNDAKLQAVENPTNGYDGQYGKSAIKTYRSFVQAKSSDDDTVKNISVLAGRVARQIDFLIKRHKSHESEWIRHSDTAKETRQTFPLILLLDNVRSAFNVGSLFRTADAAGCSRVVTTGITPHPGGSGAEKLTKSALGADRMVPSCHFDNTLQAIESLKEKLPDYKLIGMETTELSAVYSDYKYPKEGMVLILGNEVTGVDTEIIPLIDALVEIPMFGAKNSLNVAACAPVVLFEALRQWKVLDSIESSE